MIPLSRRYGARFETMLGHVAESIPRDVPLVPFWPLQGRRSLGGLFVIGRSVNGWVEDWTAGQLRDAETRAEAARHMRADAEPDHRDRMAWVTDLWGRRGGYSTARSAFWRAVRRLTTDGERPPDDWPSLVTWTNLYKVAPATGWNPGADLQRAQLHAAIDLLQMELAELHPARVVAMTGTWIKPFEQPLGLRLAPRSGLVEAVGTDGARTWVIAKHPMGKPGDAFVSEVRAALAGR